MKKFFIFTIISLTAAITHSGFSQDIRFYRDLFITGIITDSEGIEHDLTNITFVEWEFRYGGIIDYYDYRFDFFGKYGDSKVEVPVEKIRKIIFVKQHEGDYINFIAKITLLNGNTRDLLMGRFPEKTKRGPTYSFAGKSDFGDEVIKLWDIKEVVFTSFNKAGKPEKVE